MNFFEQQDHARRTTRKLVALYMLAVLGATLTLIFGIAFVIAITASLMEHDFRTVFMKVIVRHDYIAGLVAFTLVVIGIPSLYKLITLRSGGSSVAKAMDGRLVMPTTDNLQERKLLNVVEEMAISAGISIPDVYVLDDERSINAMVAGFSSKDAAVIVTQGLLKKMERDELQAVIGHEFSHILNGDMRLNIRLISVLHGIFALTILGVTILEMANSTAKTMSSTRRSTFSKKNNSVDGMFLIFIATVILGIFLWLTGQIWFFFGRLIQCSISRQREFLADASSVQFTRNPQGLADALKLIGIKSSVLASPNTANIEHMLFAAGRNGLFATHPPLFARILKLEPDFNADRYAIWAEKREAKLVEETKSQAKETVKDTDAEEARIIRNAMYGAYGAARRISAEAVQSPKPKTLNDMSWLSHEDRNLLRDPFYAECCVCGVLLSDDQPVRDLQLSVLPLRFENDSVMINTCLAWQEKMKGKTVRQRRISCELAIATIRKTPPKNLELFCAGIDKICRADDEIEPFEFVLTCMIRRRLQTDATLVQAQQSTLRPSALAPEISRVLSVISVFDASSNQAANNAWEFGKQRMLQYTDKLEMLDSDNLYDFDAFDAALSKLERLSPLFKREFMQACLDVAKYDGDISDNQENLLFATADAIDAIGWNATWN